MSQKGSELTTPLASRRKSSHCTHSFILLTKHRHGDRRHQDRALIIGKLNGERKASYLRMVWKKQCQRPYLFLTRGCWKWTSVHSSLYSIGGRAIFLYLDVLMRIRAPPHGQGKQCQLPSVTPADLFTAFRHLGSNKALFGS